MDLTGHRDAEPPLYRYQFGSVEFDEARLALHVGRTVVELEQRPLQVLAALLSHADEVVTREELFETVWAGRPTVDNVLANAVAKLRKALGPEEARRIINVPRVGYRLQGPVARVASGRRLHSRLDLAPGWPVPGREHFRLVEQLGGGQGRDVWLARNGRTGEARVYKFAAAGQQLAQLKREVTVYRVLHERLGEREDFAQVLDWNFEVAPFWLECAHGGSSLAQWAATAPGLAALTRAQRLQLFLQIADAIAVAHRAGVLHKDIKPANVLVAARDGGWQVRIADFGNSRLLEPEQLHVLGITALGLTLTSGQCSEGEAGTPLYLAPELLAGHAPTVQSDVYALGLMLYQIIVGDLRRVLAPGWEAGLDDELLREDIAAATDGTPVRRLHSVEALCLRLRGLESRRLERERLRTAEARAREAERRLQHHRAQRPWIAAALLLLVTGLAASLWQYWNASRARDEAQRQAAIATATNRFLNEDLLGAGIGGDSPAWYERNPRLREILDAAAQRLDGRFAKAPLLAADIHQTLGRAYLSGGAYAKAVVQLQDASRLLHQALGVSDERSLRADYELAVMLSHLSRFAEATALLDRADAAAGARLGKGRVSELALRSHLARGDVLYQQMRVAPALAAYRAAQPMQQILHPGDAMMAAHILLSIAGCDLRIGHAAEAERIARQILAGTPYTEARVGMSTLALARSRLGDALRAQGRYAEAIPVVQQALGEYTQVQGDDGQGTLTVLSALGYLYSLTGDDARALSTQREVYRRTLYRWGADNQYTLVERLNLGSQELDNGDVESALADLQAADRGLARVAGPRAPTLQAARVAEASALSALGRNAEALALVEQVDPAAYQATTSDPGRGAVLQAIRAQILLRMGRMAEGKARMQAALQSMRDAGVSQEEMAPYREALAGKTGT